MSLPRAAYTNLGPMLVRPGERHGAAERKAAARTERDAEARLKRKIEQANGILDRLEARRCERAKLVKLLQKRNAADDARVEKIEDRILTEMGAAGLSAVTGLRCSWRAQASAISLEVVDQTRVPKTFIRTSTSDAVDKLAVKAALAADPDLDAAAWGCKLTSKVSLVRK